MKSADRDIGVGLMDEIYTDVSDVFHYVCFVYDGPNDRTPRDAPVKFRRLAEEY